jgi:hypothetical protein
VWGITNRIISQEINVGTWIVLGEFDFLAGHDNYIRLTDLSTTDTGLGVWFDAIRWKPITDVPPLTITNIQPPHQATLASRTVDFSWQKSDAGIVSSTQLEVSSEPEFNNLVATVNLIPDADDHRHTFGSDYPTLYWRVRVFSYLHGVVLSSPTRFTIDTVPPVSWVNRIYELPNSRFVVGWAGNGTGSAITGYNVEYRQGNTDEWVLWLSNTQWTGALFIPPTGNGHDPVFWFRSQATDAAGNVEIVPPDSPGDIHTGEAVYLEHSVILPIIRR